MRHLPDGTECIAMEEKKESIFRKKSLDRISSPEELDNYLSVTGPGVWFPMLAVVALLIGALVWMAFGRLDTTVNVAVVSANGSAVCLVPGNQLENVLSEGSVQIAGAEYALTDDGRAVQLVTGDTDVNVRLAGNLSDGDTVKPLRVDGDLPEGIFAGVVVVDSINPIKFIIN